MTPYLSCNIYGESTRDAITGVYADKHECKNYGWNWPDVDNDVSTYEGINLVRLFHSNYLTNTSENVRTMVGDFLANNVLTFENGWPKLTEVYAEFWAIWQTENPIANDTGLWTYDGDSYNNGDDAEYAQAEL